MPKYVTEYQVGGLTYGDYVEADSWEAAQAVCDNRRPHCMETVTGELVAQYEVDDDVMLWLGANQN